jgi:hypothetical protein
VLDNVRITGADFIERPGAGQDPSLALEVIDALTQVASGSTLSTERALDRHWRNVKVLASHNPSIYKHQVLGAYELNSAHPLASTPNDVSGVPQITFRNVSLHETSLDMSIGGEESRLYEHGRDHRATASRVRAVPEALERGT